VVSNRGDPLLVPVRRRWRLPCLGLAALLLPPTATQLRPHPSSLRSRVGCGSGGRIPRYAWGLRERWQRERMATDLDLGFALCRRHNGEKGDRVDAMAESTEARARRRAWLPMECEGAH
jgi:hypothetical protein